MPQLGPPLPGDLGHSILALQQAIGTVPPAAGADQRAQAVEAERQRLAAEQKAARESGVMMQVSDGKRDAVAEAPASVAAAMGTSDATAAHIALDPDKDPNGQQRKADFVGSDRSHQRRQSACAG